jgi:hypothetical protein
VKARAFLYMSGIATIISGAASAGSLSTEPKFGVSVDYSTDPLLQNVNAGAETHEAILLDVPFQYIADAAEYDLSPRARISDSHGYDSLAANYTYVDATAKFNTEVDALTMQASVGRDSSLYYAGELSNGVGVRRDTDSLFLNWDRSFSEQLEFQPSLSWTQVHYGQSGVSSLVDYRYINASPTFAYSWSERDTFKLIGSTGDYHSLNGVTQSRDYSVQIGIDRELTEIWKFSASIGDSRSTNKYNSPLGSIESTQNGGVYSASLFRNGEHGNLGIIVSRALRPTGFAFSSRQDSVDFSANYDKSERLSFNMRASWKKNLDPSFGGQVTISRRYSELDFSAVWHWTSEWVMTVTASRLSQQYAFSVPGLPGVDAASSNITLELSRQFLRIEL